MRTIKEEHGRLAPGPVRAGTTTESTGDTEDTDGSGSVTEASVDLCVLCGDSVLQTTQSVVDSGVAAIQLPS